MDNPEKLIRSVFIGNIPYDASEDEILDILNEAGQIVAFRLVRDRDTGKSKGYGFCEYDDVESAKYAIKNMNSTKIYGRYLRIGPSNKDYDPLEYSVNAKQYHEQSYDNSKNSEFTQHKNNSQYQHYTSNEQYDISKNLEFNQHRNNSQYQKEQYDNSKNSEFIQHRNKSQYQNYTSNEKVNINDASDPVQITKKKHVYDKEFNLKTTESQENTNQPSNNISLDSIVMPPSNKPSKSKKRIANDETIPTNEELQAAFPEDLSSLNGEQLFHLMVEIKKLINVDPNGARSLLAKDTKLLYTLLHAQIIMKNIDLDVAIKMLNRTDDQIPHLENEKGLKPSKIKNPRYHEKEPQKEPPHVTPTQNPPALFNASQLPMPPNMPRPKKSRQRITDLPLPNIPKMEPTLDYSETIKEPNGSNSSTHLGTQQEERQQMSQTELEHLMKQVSQLTDEQMNHINPEERELIITLRQQYKEQMGI